MRFSGLVAILVSAAKSGGSHGARIENARSLAATAHLSIDQRPIQPNNWILARTPATRKGATVCAPTVGTFSTAILKGRRTFVPGRWNSFARSTRQMDLETALLRLPPPNPVLAPAYWDDPEPSEGNRCPSRSSRGSSRASLAITAGDRFRMMHVESGLEYKWAVIIDGFVKPSYFVEQPEIVKYLDFNGKQCSHRFDFYVTTPEKRTLIEIKPAIKVRKYNLEAKFQHIASQVPADRADEVLLLTDEDLNRDAVHNAQLLRESRRYPAWDFEDAILAVARDIGGIVRIRTLLEMAGVEIAGGFVAVLGLIDRRRLTVQDEGRIAHHSRVAAAETFDVRRTY